MTITLLLVRHGETDWNRAHRFQGHGDPPLGKRGLVQVRELAARLASWPVVAVHSSDLLRARQTAIALAAPHGLPVHVDPRWREVSFGRWEGLTWAEIAAVDPDRSAAWRQDPEHVSPPGGESLAELRSRLEGPLRTLPTSGLQLLVTHGGPLRVLLGRRLAPTGWALTRLTRPELPGPLHLPGR